MPAVSAALAGLLLAVAPTLVPPTTVVTVDATTPPSGLRISGPASGPVARVSLAALRRGIIRGTNAERRAQGLKSVTKDRCLTRNAQRHALRLVGLGTLQHQDLAVVFRQCRGFARVGENILYNTSGDPAECVQQWMDSPPHRENLLRPDYRRIGVGAAFDLLRNRYYAVQVFGTRTR